MPKQVLKPDLDFVEYIVRRGGGDTLKKCFQCATCSTVCSLSPDERPFPRKEMIMTQWGLKEWLLKDPDIWLCHNCHDCSLYCPRGAKPGEVMDALRNYFITRCVVPDFLAKSFFWITYPLITSVILALYFLILGNPLSYALIAFILISCFAFGVAGIGLARFWISISSSPTLNRGLVAKRGFLASLVSATMAILRHTYFSRCKTNRGNYLSHLLILYGTLGLMAVCVGALIYWGLTGQGLPLPLVNPLKIIGIMGGLALLIGLSLVIYRRLLKRREIGPGNYFDWFFIGLVWMVAATGLLIIFLRLSGVIGLAHQFFMLHLLFVFNLALYTPFSKVMHPFYRLLAMTYAKQIGRELPT